MPTGIDRRQRAVIPLSGPPHLAGPHSFQGSDESVQLGVSLLPVSMATEPSEGGCAPLAAFTAPPP